MKNILKKKKNEIDKQLHGNAKFVNHFDFII